MAQKNNDKQSPHWLDQVVSEAIAWQKEHGIKTLHVDDMKTPSGRVHTGSLRGVLLHDLVAKAVAEKKSSVKSTYVFNDMDPMDGLPGYLDQDFYQAHMGKPLYQIPAPPLDNCGINLERATQEEIADFQSAKNFGEFYAYDFLHAFRRLGCDQEIVWSHQLYESGQMDDVIREALDNVDKFRQIYKEVADYDLPKKWYPFQVICPECGKVGTTLVTDWDGEQVTFECQPNKVEWAKGCGYQGKISPFGGNGKLLWKVDWPAHWKAMGVNVEGAGKDHTSAGGSRDMANAICDRVFKITQPFDIPYEWILIRGAKMSSSKGIGTSAREFVSLFPPEVGRFLFANKHYGQVIDFDPRTLAVADLFDSYDEGAKIFWGENDGDQRLARSYQISQINQVPKPHFLPRFRDLATWIQYPTIDITQQFEQIKGSALNKIELSVLEERVRYAKYWLENFAGEDLVLQPPQNLPPGAENLSKEEVSFVKQIFESVMKEKWTAENLQQHIFETAKATVTPKKGFRGLYQVLIGKDHGPKAAWLLLSVGNDLLKTRLQQLNNYKVEKKESLPILDRPKLFTISAAVQEKYPSINIGLAVIRGITVADRSEELEQEKEQVFRSLRGFTNREIAESDEISSYRELYKQTGVKYGVRRPSPDALLRRVVQNKPLATINTCVDAYNLIVIKNRISVGAFDLDQLQPGTRLDFTVGGEQILLLGDDQPTTLRAGEICYFDQAGPYNVDFNYRDAQRVAITTATKDIIINIEGVGKITRQQVEKSLREVVEKIIKYCGGKLEVMGIVPAG